MRKKEIPTSQEEAFGFTPLKYLIPSQDVSTLSSSYNIHLQDISVANPSTKISTLAQVWSSLATKDTYLEPIVTYMKELVQAESSTSYEKLNFKGVFAVGEPQEPSSHINNDKPNTDLKLHSESYIGEQLLDTIFNIPVSENTASETKNPSKSTISQEPSEATMSSPLSPIKDLSSLDMFYEAPSLKKRKITEESKKEVVMNTSDNIETSHKVYIDPNELQLSSINQLIGLINSIGLDDAITSSSLSRFFVSADPTKNTSTCFTDGDATYVLNNELLSNIEDLLNRIFSEDMVKSDDLHGSAHQNNVLDSRYLSRIEALCAISIKHGLTIQFDESFRQIFSGHLSNDTLNSLSLVRNALRSCSVILIIFLSGRKEQMLYLEDYLAPLIEFVANFTEEFLLPLLSGFNEIQIFDSKIFDKLKNELFSPVNLLIQALKKIDKYTNLEAPKNNSKSQSTHIHSRLNEYLLTKLEYLCIQMLFFDQKLSAVNKSASSKILSENTIQVLKNTGMDILVSIFRKYQSQRSFILEEILNNFNIQTLGNTKHNASRQFKLNQRGLNVQSFTILVLRLVQAYDLANYTFSIPIWKNFLFKSSYYETFQTSIFITDPKTGKIKISSKEKSKLYQEISNFQKFMENERNSLNTVCGQIASFMIIKLSDNPDAAHKTLVENFLEDLLSLISLPEWAGAETLVLAIMNILMYVFTSGKYAATVETFALEMIGLIGCKILALKKKIKNIEENHDSRKLMLSVSMSVSGFQDLVDRNESCLSYLKYLSSINKFFEPNFRFFVFKWLQSVEYLKLEFVENALKDEENDNGETAVTKEDDLLKELTIIKKQRNIEKKLNSNSALYRKVEGVFLKYISHINDKSLDFITDADLKSEDSSNNTSLANYNHVLASQNLMNLYDAFLSLVLNSLNHSKVKSRTRAIKNLSLVVKRDATILDNSSLRKVLLGRLNDQSPLVRDAIIDLICQYIINSKPNSNEVPDSPENNSPAIKHDFQRAVIERINDPSAAVQRRILKLINSVYTDTEYKELKVLIATNLLRAMHHEDASIIDMAAKNLIDIWFTVIQKELAKKATNDFIVTDLVLDGADIITSAIHKSDKVWSLFEEFARQFVLFNGEKGTQHRRKISFSLKHDEIMEILQVYIEKLIDYAIKHTDDPKHGDKVERFIGLLAVLSKCSGSLISQDQLMLLSPYLNDDNSTTSAICYHALQIFKNALPQATSLRPQFIKDSQLSLLKRLTKFNVRELNEAMPCIWALSIMDKDTSKLANACISCLKLIKPFVDKIQRSQLSATEPKLLRLLYLIGSFGRYCNFEKNRDLFASAKIGLKDGESITSVITKYILSFCKESASNQIRRVAIRNLISVCSNHAKLFISESVLKIIDREFAKPDETNLDVKEVIVQGITDFLIQEEENAIKKAGLGISTSSDIKLDVNVFHGTYSSKENDGICAPIVQRYLEKVLALCLLQYQNTYIFVNFLEQTVKQGFANPRLVITTIIALEFSGSNFIRRLAHEMHRNLHNKHETLVESRYIEGLKLSFSRHSSKYPNAVDVNAFKEFYQILCTSRASKKKFLISLSKSFNTIDVIKNDVGYCEKYKNYVESVVARLGKVELSTLEEYYLVCQSINKHLLKHAATLQDQFELLSSPEQENEEIIDSKHQQKILNNSELENWKKLAYVSQAFICLYKYKSFICEQYRISSSKLRDFNPHRVEKDLSMPLAIGNRKNLRIEPLCNLSDPNAYGECKNVCSTFIDLFFNKPFKTSFVEEEVKEGAEYLSEEEGSDCD
ncbi:cohesin-loading factor complex subunit [Saccharomycopsis crataegensis]|uniref:Sister chromatid cohesion protein n=1 Tax=Saccharomycopsis crataegensis TaxID=43959 RepID=A0AAV5QL49_9ASCO|nr:cohesin-loading factor complex subunit [Saccharomycopsis crataegensis]